MIGPIRFELPAAPSTNNLYATAIDKEGVPHRHLVKSARAWKADAVSRIKVGLRMHFLRDTIPPMPDEMSVRLTLHWKPSVGKRKRDIDNQKALLDALATGLDVDDSRFRHLEITRVDLESGGIEHVVVVVGPLADEGRKTA